MEDNVLKYQGKEIYKLDFPIRKVIEYLDRFVVLLKKPYGIMYNENVFCISKEGKFLWQIEETRKENSSPYSEISFIDDKIVEAFNMDSWTEFVDLNTGRIIKSKFVK